MRRLDAMAVALCLAALPAPAVARQTIVHFPPLGPRPAGVPADAPAPFSSAVMAGDTLYLAGTTDIDPVTHRPPVAAKDGARLVMDALQRSVEAAGLTMDDLVWVQVYATDLGSFSDFGDAYDRYFHGPKPARTFVGVAALMGGAHFEVNAIAVRKRER